MNDTTEGSRSARTGKFQKGHSGNPKGRPRKPAPAPRSVFEIVFEKRVTITAGGTEREVPIAEALQLRTYQDALEGKRAAQREVLKWIAKRNKARGYSGQPMMSPAVKIRKLAGEPRNADPAMRLLGIAAPDLSRQKDPRALLLEPWAVQSALSRRRGGKALTADHVHHIQRCTRAAETLRWPRGTKR